MPRLATSGVRDQVIEAALRRLDAAGPEAVTLRSVAGAVGRSTQAIYSHFRDRDDLMAALRVAIAVDVARRAHDRFQASVPRDLDGMLEAAGLALVDYALEHPHLYRHANTGPPLLDFVQPSASPQVAAAWDFLLAPLRAARAGPSADRLQLELRLRWAMTHGIATLAINGNYGARPRATAHGLLRAAMRLRPAASTPAS